MPAIRLEYHLKKGIAFSFLYGRYVKPGQVWHFTLAKHELGWVVPFGMLEPQTCRFAVTAELLRWVWILPHLDIETVFNFQVSAIQEEANRLQGSYAGDKAKEIQAKEDEVVDAWKRLNWRVKQRTERLHDADDLYRFLLAVQDQMLWMNDMLKQILTYEKAK